MPVYPTPIAQAIRNPRYCRPTDLSAVGSSDANFDCGCYIRFQLQIETSSLTISEAGYSTNGCGYVIAAAEDLCARIEGRSIRDIHGELVVQSNGRPQCSALSLNALKGALSKFRSHQIEEFRGEKALICTCFGIEEEAIENFIKSERPSDVEGVSRATQAGRGCGSCLPLIDEILDAHS